VPADIHQLLALFESIEKGSSQKLQQFLSEAQYKYEVGMQDLVQKPGHNLLEFADRRVIKGVFKLHLLESFHNYVRKYFSHPKLIQLLEFPVLFLGAEPKNIPALYSLMNYADMQLGTWYPEGGMYKIVEAMANLANELGVKIRLNETVNEIICEEKNIKKIISSHGIYLADYVVGGADYHHIEQHLLPIQYRQYSEEYWNSRVLAPSSLLYYIGLDTTLDNLEHHNLFFDADFNKHSEEIYKNPAWPSDPLFYVSVTSKTDNTVAPFGCENIFILIPTATDMPESKSIQEHYFTIVMNRLEKHVGKNIREHIIFRRDYAHSNFVADYNSYKGNAYGLANTLMQTAILKPKLLCA
jgi:phytoene desaturase